jgi:hypothetical protein
VYQTYSILLEAKQKLYTKKNGYQGRAEKEGIYSLKIINMSTGHPSWHLLLYRDFLLGLKVWWMCNEHL